MRPSPFSGALIPLLVLLGGCEKRVGDRLREREELRCALEQVPKGRPLKLIESEFKLPEAEKQESPASDDPHIKCRYRTERLVVTFLADAAGGDLRSLVYAGEPRVYLIEEWDELLKNKFRR